MKHAIILAPLMLMACNSGPEVSARNASVEEVAAKAQGVMRMEPGLWTTTTDVQAIEMPGMDDPRIMKGITGQLKESQAKPTTHCVTAEEAARPSAEMFAGKTNGECRYDKFDMGGGRLDAAMTCSPKGQPGAMKMTMNGSYSATAYDLAMNMKVSNPAMPGGGMTMKATTKGARTGACTAEQRNAG